MSTPTIRVWLATVTWDPNKRNTKPEIKLSPNYVDVQSGARRFTTAEADILLEDFEIPKSQNRRVIITRLIYKSWQLFQSGAWMRVHNCETNAFDMICLYMELQDGGP